MATNRPKQRVLVRWNDDLDKSLLLFITHTCTEMGIKIPYDEIARRMGSTFTEGAIQQHISKLRNKMAELNVAPVPAPAKRGAVTVKPSGVYGQKGRAGAAPQQPVASKTQARATATVADGKATTRPAATAKRSYRRRQATIKRSESDEGPTDEEFGGASDEDFQGNPNANGKRAGIAQRQGPTYKKVTTSQPQETSETITRVMNHIVDADARYQARYPPTMSKPQSTNPIPTNLNGMHPMFATQSIQAARPPPTPTAGPASFYDQLAQAAGYDEEEEEEDEEVEAEPPRLGVSGHFVVPSHNPAPFNSSQDEQLSPRSIIARGQATQPRRYPQYNGPQPASNNYAANIQQASQLLTASQDSGISSNSGMDYAHYPLDSQPRTPFQPNHMSSPMLPPYPPPTMAGISSYNAMQQAMRNNSMASASSQNTLVHTPPTPTMSTSAGVNNAYRNNFNDWARSDYNTLAMAPNQVTSAWGLETRGDTEFTFDEARLDQSSGDSFMHDLFN